MIFAVNCLPVSVKDSHGKHYRTKYPLTAKEHFLVDPILLEAMRVEERMLAAMKKSLFNIAGTVTGRWSTSTPNP